jgi:hypothetical protein
VHVSRFWESRKHIVPDVLTAPHILLIYKKDGNHPMCIVSNATKQQGTRTPSFIFLMHVPDGQAG